MVVGTGWSVDIHSVDLLITYTLPTKVIHVLAIIVAMTAVVSHGVRDVEGLVHGLDEGKNMENERSRGKDC